MATIALYANQINQMPGLLKEVKQSVSNYKSELTTLKNKTLTINKSICDLEDVISSIQSSTKTQEEKIASLDAFYQNSETFIADVVQIDNNVESLINKRKNDFYSTYSYLKPNCEKDFWEKFYDNVLVPVGQWCKEHWVEILVGLAVILIGALITFATGGAFLAALLAGLKMAIVAGLISGGISAGISLIGSIINGEDLGTALKKALSAFGDGFASGFMLGGIMAGASMVISSGFRLIARLGVTPGIRGGKYINKAKTIKMLSPDSVTNKLFKAKDFPKGILPRTEVGVNVGGGTLIKIGKVFRLDSDLKIIGLKEGVNPLKLANFWHMHVPKLGKEWKGSIPWLFIPKGHIPIGLYTSIGLGVFNRKE